MDKPITLEEERKVWKICQSVSGVTYYYNRSTKKSQYEMPECFKITEEDTEHPDWKEYRSAEGRKFYYNALTRKSCWHLPAEVKEWKVKLQEQKKKDRQNGIIPAEEQKLSEVDEAKKKFMALLKSKSVGINTKWDACITLCQDDDRWNLLKMSEKKKYFNDYISQLKKINEMQRKAKNQANKLQFMKMLKQHKNLTSDCKMHKVQFEFITDPRWRLLEGVDRENAFQEHLDELFIKQRQQNKKQRDLNIQNLKSILQSREVHYNMQWDAFRKMFRDEICYKSLSPVDRITTFINYILEAQKRHEENEAKQKRLRQRTNRINFRQMVKEKLFQGDISYKTKWRNFVKDFREEQSLINMMDPHQQGSSAHEIFEHFMHSIRQNHKTLKSQIKNHFKKIGFKMSSDTKKEDFLEKLVDLPVLLNQKQTIKQYFFFYFNQKIKSKNLAKLEKQKEKEKQKNAQIKKAQKREKKAIYKIFDQIYEHRKNRYSSIADHISKIQDSLKQQSISISRESIFKYYLNYLDAGGEEGMQKNHQRESRSKSSSSEIKRKKKKKDHQPSQETPAKKEKQFKIFNIPATLKGNDLDADLEQEGQIKDEEIPMEKYQDNKKKKTHKKSRKKSSSSDSD